jgi:carbonic anhydrase
MDNKQYKIKTKFVTTKNFVNKFFSNLAILCSDERFNKEILGFLNKKLKVKRQDLLILPGSIAFYVLNETNNVAKLELLIEKHNIKNVYVFTHTDCGFYKSVFKNLNENELLEKQIKDVIDFKKGLLKKYKKLNIKIFYVGLKNKKIVISEIKEY